jgi:transposase
MSVPGIGPLISTALVAAIGTGEAFDRGRDFGAWLGLVPRQYSTGGRSSLGRISKRGSTYLRTLLIQAANVLLMRPHNWARVAHGSLRAVTLNKLAVALANKQASIPTIQGGSCSNASLRANRLIFLRKAILPLTPNPTR